MQFEDYKRIFSNIMDDDMHLYSNQYDIWQLLLDMKETLSFNDKDVRDYAMTISKYTHELATYKAAETGSGEFRRSVLEAVAVRGSVSVRVVYPLHGEEQADHKAVLQAKREDTSCCCAGTSKS